MNGIDKITQRIAEDAQKEAQDIINSSQVKANEIKEQKAKDGQNIKESLALKSQEEADERKRRMISAANLEMKQRVLATKQQMIDKTIDAVLERISNMPRSEYESLILNLLLSYPLEGNEEIISPGQDGRRLDKGFINRVNKRLKSQGKKGQLKLSPQNGGFKTGFVINSKGVEINNSFEAVLRTVRDEVEPEVAVLLFGEE